MNKSKKESAKNPRSKDLGRGFLMHSGLKRWIYGELGGMTEKESLKYGYKWYIININRVSNN